MDRSERVALFQEMHDERLLVLPNAWDAASAAAMERAGAAALGTTSAGVCWAHGRADGQTLSRDEMVRAVRTIVEAVAIPVTADIEGGYGDGTPDDVAATVRAVIDAGAVGINLEDAPGRGGELLLTVAEQVERLRAARSAADAVDADLFINARTDVYLAEFGAPESRLDEALRRGEAYLAAGADCVFVPGVIDAETIATLARELGGPLNVMAGPGAPPIPELAALGVARVSVGPAIIVAVLDTVRRATAELLEAGTYGTLAGDLTFLDVNGWFSNHA